MLTDVKDGIYYKIMLSKTNKTSNVMSIVDQNSLNGKIADSDSIIEFTNVPICTPNGDVLVIQFHYR